jgi:presenilin 1
LARTTPHRRRWEEKKNPRSPTPNPKQLQCYRVIAAYMGFSLFNIFFLLTGAVLVALCRTLAIPLDAVTLSLLLANLAAVGTAAIFFLPAPLALRQALLIWVGVVMAFVFSLVPEWTTWCLLAAMAAYDLVAVLMPGGPLKILVELAVERQVDLPALVYESRPAGGRAYARGAWMRRGGRGRGEEGEGAADEQQQQPAREQPQPQQGRQARWWRPPGAGGGGRDGSPSARVALLGSGLEVGLAESPSSRRSRMQQQDGGGGGGGGGPVAEGVEEEEEAERQRRQPLSGGGGASSSGGGGGGGGAAVVPPESAPAPAPAPAPATRRGAGGESSGRESDDESGSDDDDDPSRPAGGMLLGMGDFIFYSALVGRAATYDLSTVFASFIAVLAGLVVTLLALGLAGRALPALPVSIALGALYCFAARWALGPVAVPLTVSGVYY